jgi:hypothetical protein
MEVTHLHSQLLLTCCTFRTEVAGGKFFLDLFSVAISNKFLPAIIYMSLDISVGIAIGYGLDDRMIGVRFPTGAGNFSLRHHAQTKFGIQSASYSVDTGGSFPGGKAVGA